MKNKDVKVNIIAGSLEEILQKEAGERLSLNIGESIQKFLLNKPVSQNVVNGIRTYISNSLVSFLHAQGLEKLKNNIEFIVEEKKEEEVALVLPSNFFTGLLLKGIVFEPALHGAREYPFQGGKYLWEGESRFVFLPSSAPNIELSLGSFAGEQAEPKLKLKESKADVLETQGKRIMIHSHIHSPGDWFFTCRELDIVAVRLGARESFKSHKELLDCIYDKINQKKKEVESILSHLISYE